MEKHETRIGHWDGVGIQDVGAGLGRWEKLVLPKHKGPETIA